MVVWCDATGHSGSQLSGLGHQAPGDGELGPQHVRQGYHTWTVPSNNCTNEVYVHVYMNRITFVIDNLMQLVV